MNGQPKFSLHHALNHHKTFGEFLLYQYHLRRAINSKYSIRSFAVKIGVDQSLASKVMRGSRQLSPSAMKICMEKLDLRSSEVDILLALFNKNTFYHCPIDDNILSIEFDWWHFAILELLKLKDFIPEVATISPRLNLDPQVVEKAIDLLVRQGYIVQENGTYILCRPNHTWSINGTINDSQKSLHKKMLEKSILSLDTTLPEHRHHTSCTMAISTEALIEIKVKLDEMTIILGKEINKSKYLNEVYQFTASLFPLGGHSEDTTLDLSSNNE
jgi:DNA-binding transcriptional regulator YhcF (GntR family)